MARFDLGERWAYHALHEDGECYGMGLGALRRAYRSADVLINLHGGTPPLDEHVATGRLVLVATDPGRLEVQLCTGHERTLGLLEAHCAAFTFGENYGRPSCGLPVSDRFRLLPTRQPVVLDFWETARPARGPYRTVASWRQHGREFGLGGQWYEWSKHYEFEKVLGAAGPVRARPRARPRELRHRGPRAARGARLDGARRRLFGTGTDPYRAFIQGARGELTAAKDQNVRLRTGWFSDRSATFLAAGRPVVTQDTGFGDALPTGRGLFAYTDSDSALVALETIESDHAAACRAAADVARECFDAPVLGRLLADVGVEGLRAHGRHVDARIPARGPPARADRAAPAAPRRRRGAHAASTRAADRSRGARALLRVAAAPDAGPSASVTGHLGQPRADAPLLGDAARAHAGPSLRDHRRGQRVHRRHARTSRRWPPADARAPDPERGQRGLRRACNQGARVARGDLLVFLNNDTVLAPGWLGGLAAHLRGVEVGAVIP